MLLTKTVMIKWNSANKKWYESKDYIFTKMGDEFEVKVNDLTNKSTTKVIIECDRCKSENNIYWYNYIQCVRKDNKCYCRKCAHELFGKDKLIKTKLKNSKSFKSWCIENNNQDILNRWDYNLNKCNPNEVLYSSNKKYYFKCPKGIHESEIKKITDFTNDKGGSLDCNVCNSFAQWGIDNICPDFLEKYWDYEKNIGIDPWVVSYANSKKVWIKCQNEVLHGSFSIRCYSFISGSRCPICNESKGEKRIEECLKINDIQYIPQKTFNGLIGLGNGLLSYDFYLEQFNLLIEYQGEYHDGSVSNQTKEEFEYQQEHDKRKKEYTKIHNINLLEIWYWDYDNIEEILNQQLNINNLNNSQEYSSF